MNKYHSRADRITITRSQIGYVKYYAYDNISQLNNNKNIVWKRDNKKEIASLNEVPLLLFKCASLNVHRDEQMLRLNVPLF